MNIKNKLVATMAEINSAILNADQPSIREKKNSIRGDLQRAKRRLKYVDDKIEDSERMLGSLDLNEEAYLVIEEHLPKLQSRREDLMRETSSLERELKKIESQEEGSDRKNFDKELCIENIRLLIEQNSLKIGDLEREAGVAVGYLSRVDSKDKTNPSIEFLVSVARIFHVSLDTLLNVRLSNISVDEQELVQFFTQLKIDTDSDEVIWSVDTLQDMVESDINHHPLFLSHDNTCGSEKTIYGSLFFPDKVIVPSSAGYHTRLRDSDDTIYIMKVREQTETGASEPNAFIEVYHVDAANTCQPICNTLQVAKEIADAINELYETATVSSTQLHISKKTRSMIGNYLKTKS